MSDQQHIFLSYSRKDYFVMDKVREIFRKEDLEVWVDENKIDVGDELIQELDEAIASACCVALLASPDSKVSKWVRKEITAAEAKGIDVYIILVRADEGDEQSAIPFNYYGVRHIDIREGKTHNLDSLIKKLIKQCKSLQPTPEYEEPPQEPPSSPQDQFAIHIEETFIDFSQMLVVRRTLDALVEILEQSCTQCVRVRAALFWVDDERDDLYIVAATSRYEDRELRLRFQRGVGFAGEVWEKVETRKSWDKIAYPEQVTNDHMRKKWEFTAEQIELTRSMDCIMSIPLFDVNGHIMGLLSIDTKMASVDSGAPSVKDMYHDDVEQAISEIDSGAREARKLFAGLLDGTRLISYRNYQLLENILTVSRLFPPLAIRIRAAIFLVDSKNEELFMLVGSEEFNKIWPAGGIRFKKNHGVIGKAWASGYLCMDNRNRDEIDNIDEYLKSKWNMTGDQIAVARHNGSILGVPITDGADNILGVLMVNSQHPMKESHLDRNLVTVSELARLVGKVLIDEDRRLDD